MSMDTNKHIVANDPTDQLTSLIRNLTSSTPSAAELAEQDPSLPARDYFVIKSMRGLTHFPRPPPPSRQIATSVDMSQPATNWTTGQQRQGSKIKAFEKKFPQMIGEKPKAGMEWTGER